MEPTLAYRLAKCRTRSLDDHRIRSAPDGDFPRATTPESNGITPMTMGELVKKSFASLRAGAIQIRPGKSKVRKDDVLVQISG